MRLITEIKIGTFLDKNKNFLLNKTNLYNKYFREDWELDIDYIQSLSDNELYSLEKSLNGEKSYLKK